ncbi:MAG TPA: sugar ABC transporter substrate-binding protein [Clostridiales bacterium UBA8960]|nr:sugar ABC transporter substrate-binding protein [Clostridiales bacterium UBA8960]
MKKFLSLLLILTMSISLFVGCGSQNNSGSNSGSVEPLVVNKDKVLQVWSFTDELKKPLEYFEEHYGIKSELTIIPTADYPTKVQPVLESGVGAPDVFTAEIAWLKQWTELPYWDDLSKAPYNAHEWKDEFVPYVYDLGTDANGNLKALSWQATPGGVIYKKWIAREVWGNDSPEFVSEKLASMDGFFKAAEELKKAGFRTLPDEGAMRWFALGSDPKPWVDADNNLSVTEARLEFLDYQRLLRENDYTAQAPEWSASWFASMAGKVGYNGGWDEVNAAAKEQVEVFGYALPTWGLHFVVKPNAAEDTIGDWGLASGPSPYFWGGTWLGVYSKSENKGAAFEFVKMMTHDEKFMTWWYEETGDLLSNIKITEKFRATASDAFLGGQNHYDFFLNEAEKIQTGIVTPYDQGIDQIWGDLVVRYVERTIETKEAFLQEFYKQVKNAYPEIKTPK